MSESTIGCLHDKQTKHENGTITCDDCGAPIFELKKITPIEFGFVVARRVVGNFVDEEFHTQANEYIDKEEQKLKAMSEGGKVNG